MTPLDEPSALGLFAVLLVIGWGFGLAAALAWSCLRPSTQPRTWRALLVGLTMATLVAASTSYGYARVLDTVGVIEYCGPASEWPTDC
jgi:hypothetical protein